MFTKKIISSSKLNSPYSPNQHKQEVQTSTLFTTQALKTTNHFYSHKKLINTNESSNNFTIESMETKADRLALESTNFFTSKIRNHSHNKSDSPKNMIPLNHLMENSKPMLNAIIPEQVPKKQNSENGKTYRIEENHKDNLHFNLKKIPTFETKIKISDNTNSNLKQHTSHPATPNNEGNMRMMIKNKDTGEVYFIENPEEAEKFQEPIHNDYFEKLKKRKKEEIWQDWWQVKRKNNQELLLAAKNNNIVQVKKLFEEETQIDTRPEINFKDEKDWTCLHYASLVGNYDLVLLLIKLEAEIDAQTNLKQTALIISAQKGFANIVSLLLTSGSNINHQDLCNNTALHYASIYGYKEVAKILLANPSVNVNLINLENRTAAEATSFPEIKKWIETAKTKARLSDQNLNKNNSLSNLRSNIYSLDKDNKHFSPEAKKKIIIEREKYDELIKPLFKINDRTLSNITVTTNVLSSSTTSVSEHDTTLFLLSDMIMEKEKIGPYSFNLLSLIGKGSFGEVYLVEKKSSHELFALKVLSKDKIISNNLVKYAITERNVLSFCSHPFIVKLHAAFQSLDRLFLVQTYCPGGDLGKYLAKEKRFTEQKARHYAAEVILALEHLHKKDIIYRDLKPENIVLDAEGHALLTDFGLSREGVYDHLVAKSFCGSIAYLAPEMLRRQGHGKAVDWYLLGVLIYEMVVGAPPYYAQNKQEIFQNIDKATLKIPSYLSKEAKSLLQRLLEKEPNLRLGSGPLEAKEIKDHPFFQDICWEDIYDKKTSPGLPYLMKPIDKNKKRIDLISAFQENNDDNSGKEEIPGWSFIENDQQNK